MPKSMADIIVEDERWSDLNLRKLSDMAIDAVLHDLSLSTDWEIGILACDDPKITELNADFRDKPTATNVLSWPANDLAPIEPGENPTTPEMDKFGDNALGDIAISYDTCVREANELGITMDDHTTHLLMHGCLHLLGYDHETDADATLMEGIESRLLEKLGIADPYKELLLP
jgi:probable rRNA maturation factor